MDSQPRGRLAGRPVVEDRPEGRQPLAHARRAAREQRLEQGASPASDRRAGCPTPRAADRRAAGPRARPPAAPRVAPPHRASRGRRPPATGGRRPRRTAREMATVRPRSSATRPAIRRPSGSPGSRAAIARRSRLSLVPRSDRRRAANRNRSSWRTSSRVGSPGTDSGWRATSTTHGGPSDGSASLRADSSRALRTCDSSSSSSERSGATRSVAIGLEVAHRAVAEEDEPAGRGGLARAPRERHAPARRTAGGRGTPATAAAASGTSAGAWSAIVSERRPSSATARPQEPADRRGQRLHAAAGHRELREVRLEHRRLALQLARAGRRGSRSAAARALPGRGRGRGSRAGRHRRPRHRGRRACRAPRRARRPASPGGGTSSSPDAPLRASVWARSTMSAGAGATTASAARRDDHEVGRLEDVQRGHPRPKHAHPADAAAPLALGHRRADRLGVGQQRREDLVERGHRVKCAAGVGEPCGAGRAGAATDGRPATRSPQPRARDRRAATRSSSTPPELAPDVHVPVRAHDEREPPVRRRAFAQHAGAAASRT